MKLLLLVLAVVGVLCVPCAGQKKGKATTKKVLPYTLAQDDLREYILGYDSTKGEFEKSTAFEARLQAMRENKPSLCLRIDEYNMNNEYNADSEMLIVDGGNGAIFNGSPYEADTSIIYVGGGISSPADVSTFVWDDYALKISNLDAIGALGLKRYKRALFTSYPVRLQRAAYAKNNYALILCVKLAGQHKTFHAIVEYDIIDNGRRHANSAFVAEAAITGFKIVDTQTNKVILEKYLQQ